MAATNLNVGHQSPQSTLPSFALKTVNTCTWGATANSCTIVDPYIHTNSDINIWVTGATPQAGNWALAITQGQLVITSSSSESSSLPISYVVS